MSESSYTAVIVGLISGISAGIAYSSLRKSNQLELQHQQLQKTLEERERELKKYKDFVHPEPLTREQRELLRKQTLKECRERNIRSYRVVFADEPYNDEGCDCDFYTIVLDAGGRTEANYYGRRH